jgi:hypothetical protein
MKLRTVLLASFLTLFLVVPIFAQTVVPATGGGTVTPAPSQCTDGKDNDGDGMIDKSGRTVGTKVYLPDVQCLTSGAICEDGSTNCLASNTGAQTCGSGLCLNIAIKNPLKVDTIQEAIKLFMDAVLKIAIPFIVLAFLWSGFSFVLARGNSEKVTKAKNMFVFTIIGTLLILGAWTITNAIIGTVNSITS